MNDLAKVLYSRLHSTSTNEFVNLALAGKSPFYAAVRNFKMHGEVTCPKNDSLEDVMDYKFGTTVTLCPHGDKTIEQGIEELYEHPDLRHLCLSTTINRISWESRIKLSKVCDYVTSLDATTRDIVLLSPYTSFYNLKHLKLGDVFTNNVEEIVAESKFLENIESLEINLYYNYDGFYPLMLLFPCLRNLTKLSMDVSDNQDYDFEMNDLTDVQQMLQLLPSIKQARFLFSGKSTTENYTSEFNHLFEAFEQLSFNGNVSINVYLDCACGINIDDKQYKHDEYGEVYRELACNGSKLRIDFNVRKRYNRF